MLWLGNLACCTDDREVSGLTPVSYRKVYQWHPSGKRSRGRPL